MKCGQFNNYGINTINKVMKGYLQKTEEGWFVVYDQRTFQDPSAEDGVLPLEPKMANYLDMNLTSTTYQKEKEFEEIELVDRINQSGIYIFKKYAKIVEPDNHIVDTNEMIDQTTDISKMEEDDELNFLRTQLKNVEYYKLGYNRAKETLYTEEQMELCWIAAMSNRAGFSDSISYKEFIQSLKKD